MEFVQYHPTGLPGTGILITEASPRGGRHLKNKDGYRYLQELRPRASEDKPVNRSGARARDILSRATCRSIKRGARSRARTGLRHLDLRHLGEKLIDKNLPFVRELARTTFGIDSLYEPTRFARVVHYMMGGISTDINGKTPLEGLYAAGECASRLV